MKHFAVMDGVQMRGIALTIDKGKALLLKMRSGLRIRVCIRGRRNVGSLPVSRDELDSVRIKFRQQVALS